MVRQSKIIAISGSTRKHSTNLDLILAIRDMFHESIELLLFSRIADLPHFNPDLDVAIPPQSVADFRHQLRHADGILICTPEYVFSIPSGLKNAIEWCVSTTVFSDKPAGLITASADGQKGHEELQLIMKTLMTKFTDETTLLIQGIKGKINAQGEISHAKTADEFNKFIEAFKTLIKRAGQ